MHILIVRNNSNPQANDASLLLVAYLNSQGISYVIGDSSELDSASETEVWARLTAQPLDLAVVLGGDGTILRTARLMGLSGVPILGINFGRLGFLANSNEEGVVAIVAAALAGDVVREQRTNLQIDFAFEGDDLDAFPAVSSLMEGKRNQEEGVQHTSFFALNELAITRGTQGRVIDFDLSISGSSLAAMRGDGLVVATATGSTAYALSAGGPLVTPSFEGLVVVPLAPHTLHSRAVVTASNDVVEVDLTHNSLMREAAFFVDGEPLIFEKPPVKVWIRRGSVPTSLLYYRRENFYAHAAQVFFR